MKYDLVIIGGGPAGTPIAMEFAKLNNDKKVALIDTIGKLGGECLFEGCIPSKIMKISSDYLKNLKKLDEFGIKIDDYKLIWEKIKKRKEEILDKRTKSAENNLPKNVDLIKGNASFYNETSIIVNEKIIEFDKCVIATGSKARKIHYEGNANELLWTNEDFFANMELPKSMSIIGTGAIAIEFTQILSQLGVKIYLFARGDTILKNIDEDAKKFVIDDIKNNPNIKIIFNSTIKEINFDEKFTINYTQNNKNNTITSEKVLLATGRIANIENLNLDKANIKYNKHGIITDKHMQTSNKNIFANGDVVSNFPKFAHTSFYSSHTIAQNLFVNHNIFSVDFDKNSWVLFSNPNIASSGITEIEAKKQNLDVIIDKYYFDIDAKAQIENQAQGFLKFIVQKTTIIGIVIVHEEAHSIAGEAAIIVANKMKLSDLISTIHPHPTLSESFSNLAKQMMGKIMKEKLENKVIKSLLEIERFL